MSNTANIVLQFMQRYQNSLDTAIKNFIKKKNPNEKGKPIASGTDLDTMKKVGVFHIANDTIAGNIVHLPQAVSGKVLVQDNGNNGVVQFYIPNGSPKLYERVWGNNTWTAWKEYGTGGGGTDDYNSLSNQPKINNVTLSGNKTTGDLGVKLSDLTDVELDEPTANQILKYDEASEKWVNGVDEGGSISGTVNYVGTCTTNADQQIKVATVDEEFELIKGVRVTILFSNNNTYSATVNNPCKLNVNNTGSKNIYYNISATPTGTSTIAFGTANMYNSYIFDGTNWVWDGHSKDIDTIYTPQSLGFGYGTCTTAESTSLKEVTLSGYNLVPNGYVSVKFTNAVPANATMNINNKGSMLIYYKGALITANIIKAGDLATFIYDGASNYHLIGIDRTVEGGGVTYLTQTLTAGNTSVTFTNSAITNNALISVYTSVANLNYTSMTIGTGTITITYPSQSGDISVILEIKNV